MYAHNCANRSTRLKNTSKCPFPGPLLTLDRCLQAAHIPSQYLYSLSLRHLYEWSFPTKWNYFSRQVIGNIFPEYNQQDAKFHNLFISVRRSTCCRRVFSVHHKALKTANTGLTNTWHCKCIFELLMMDGKKPRLKLVDRLTDINKLWNVASCWLYSANILALHGTMNVKFIGKNFVSVTPGHVIRIWTLRSN